MDKKEALKQIKAGELYLEDVEKKLKADKEVVLAAVKENGSALEYADKKLKADKKFVLAALKQNGYALEYADKKLKADKEVVLAAVKQDGYALEYADKKLKADKEVVFAAVKQNGLAFDYADKTLQADKEVVLAAVKQYGSVLEYADKKFKADKEVVLAALKQNGRALEYADKKLKADKEVVLIAVQQEGFAIRYADKKFKADKEVVLIAVQQEGFAIRYADKKFKADKEVVLAAVKHDGLSLYCADKKLRADKEVVATAVKQDKTADRFALQTESSSFKYELTFIGGNTEVSIKSYLPELDIPEEHQWDDYPGDYINEYEAQDIDGGFILVELVEKNQKNTNCEQQEKFPLSDILQPVSREVIIGDSDECGEDKVLCRIGEGKGGLGRAFLEIDEPFNIKKVFISLVETYDRGDLMERIYYDGKEIALDYMDINFGSFSMQINSKFMNIPELEDKSRIENKVQDFLEEQPLWFEDDTNS